MKRIIFLIFIYIFFMATNANATNAINTINVECNHCTTDAQYEFVAGLYVQPGQVKDVYILNWPSAQIRKYQVAMPSSRNGRGDPSGQLRITLQTVEVAKKADFIDAVVGFNALQEANSEPNTVPASIAGSAWELVGAGFSQNDVIDYMNNNSTRFSDIKNLFSVLLTLPLLTRQPASSA